VNARYCLKAYENRSSFDVTLVDEAARQLDQAAGVFVARYAVDAAIGERLSLLRVLNVSLVAEIPPEFGGRSGALTMLRDHLLALIC
jgi:hypothetical protein